MAKAKFYGTGRRKKSVARVYLVPGTGNITINKRDIDEYLGLETLKVVVRQPLVATETADKFDVIVNVKGGGYTGQAGAIRHGIARALLEADSEYRPVLKKAGYLTRDPRMKERKKYGLKASSSRTAVQQTLILVIKEIIVWDEKMHTKPQKPCVSGVFLYPRIFMGCPETWWKFVDM